MTQPHNAPETRYARRRWLMRLAVGLLLVGVLVARRGSAGDASLRSALANVGWPVVVGAVGFYLIGQVLSAWKWQILLRARGIGLPLRECCRLYWLGMFWNLWMPTNIGGDAVRALAAGRAAPQNGGAVAAASSVIVERVTGLLALLFLGAVALAASHRGDGTSNARHLLTVSVLALAVFSAMWLLSRALLYRLEAGASGKVQRIATKLAALFRALDAYAQPSSRRTLILALALSLVFQASQIALNVFLARAIGLQVPVLTIAWLVPMLALASLLPLGIGGLGVREAAAVALLSGVVGAKVPATGAIIAWSLLWQATVWLASLPGGIWALRWKATSQPVAREKEPPAAVN